MKGFENNIPRYLAITTLLLSSTFFLANCGGGSSPPPPAKIPSSKIPKTSAVAPIPPLVAAAPTPSTPAPNQAILRVVYRKTLSGVLSPNGDYLDSENVKVEKRGLFGLYANVSRQADKRYGITPEQNGLAYFKVTTTKANGSVRVHNFFGVKPGYYMTFDTSDVTFQKPENPLAACRKVDIRLLNLPSMGVTTRLSVNGQLVSSSIIENNKGFIQQINLCPIDFNQHYLAVVSIENSASDIRYGFNYYQNIQDNDFLEINVDRQADIIPWNSNHEIGNDFTLSGIQNGWEVYVNLYTSPKRGNLTGSYPRFSDLSLSSYRFMSDSTNINIGVKLNTRELSTNSSQINFNINNTELTDLALNPTNLTWLNIGIDRPEVISGLLFNSSLTETYAFVSMDPNVLSKEKFEFPLDDIPLVVDSLLYSVTGAAGINNGDLAYLSQVSLFSGFLYWPTDQSNGEDNSDLFITANGSALLQFILDNKITP